MDAADSIGIFTSSGEPQAQGPAARGFLLLLVLATGDATSAAGGNETDLGTRGLVAAHSGGSTNVLVVTTTVGMLDGLFGWEGERVLGEIRVNTSRGVEGNFGCGSAIQVQGPAATAGECPFRMTT